MSELSEYVIRPAHAGEEKLMHPLWKEVFGDEERFIASYEKWVFHPDRVDLALWQGKAVCMMSMMPARLQRASGETHSCGYYWALATLAEHRSRGIASRLIQRALDRKMGSEITCAAGIPDTPGLFIYYGHTMNAKPAFYVRELRISAAQVAHAPAYSPQSVSDEAYAALRKKALQGRTFMEWSQDAISYQGELCRLQGGGFYTFSDGPGCCAAVEYQEDGTFVICELLAPEEQLEACLSGLFTHFEEKEGILRLPAWSGEKFGGSVSPFGVLNEIDLPPEEQAYIGFDFV